MTVGERLLLSICINKRFDVLVKVKREKLLDKEELFLFKFISEYYKTTNDLPSWKKINEKFEYEDEPDDKAEFYLKELNERHVYTTLGENMPKIVRELRGSPLETLDKLSKMVSELNSDEGTSDEFYSDNPEKRFEAYEERKKSGGITYLSTGDDYLDKITFGYKETDLWTLGGRAGTKKTFSLAYLASKCEESLPDDKGDILFISNEMNNEEMKERFDAIKFKLNYERLQAGTLTAAEEQIYKRKLIMLKARKSRIILVFNVSTLDELRIKASIYRPSIIFLDGSYLLYPEIEDGMGKNMKITRGMKKICNDMSVPIVNTTQLRKKTGRKMMKDSLSGQDEFYYGGYVQDSDFAVRTFVTPSMVYNGVIGWDFVKSRRVKRHLAELKADLDTMDFEFRDRGGADEEEEIVEY